MRWLPNFLPPLLLSSPTLSVLLQASVQFVREESLLSNTDSGLQHRPIHGVQRLEQKKATFFQRQYEIPVFQNREGEKPNNKQTDKNTNENTLFHKLISLLLDIFAVR